MLKGLGYVCHNWRLETWLSHLWKVGDLGGNYPKLFLANLLYWVGMEVDKLSWKFQLGHSYNFCHNKIPEIQYTYNINPSHESPCLLLFSETNTSKVKVRAFIDIVHFTITWQLFHKITMIFTSVINQEIPLFISNARINSVECEVSIASWLSSNKILTQASTMRKGLSAFSRERERCIK